MGLAVVLISVLPTVEAWFDGIDRTAVWHCRLSVVAMLLVPHVLFAQGHRPPTWGQLPQRHGADVGGLLAHIEVWGLLTLVVCARAVHRASRHRL